MFEATRFLHYRFVIKITSESGGASLSPTAPVEAHVSRQ